MLSGGQCVQAPYTPRFFADKNSYVNSAGPALPAPRAARHGRLQAVRAQLDDQIFAVEPRKLDLGDDQTDGLAHQALEGLHAVGFLGPFVSERDELLGQAAPIGFICCRRSGPVTFTPSRPSSFD